MLRLVNFIICIATNILCFADYLDRGRPCDHQDTQEGPFTYVFYVFMVICIIFVLALIVYWIFQKISNHKEQISNVLGTIFIFAIIFGCVFLVGKCNENTNTSIDPEKPTEQINTNEIIASPSVSNPLTNYQNEPTVHTQTIHYRTVEYYESCSNCDGSGYVSCPRCNGTGFYKKDCDWCDGTGGYSRSPCIYCGGEGYREDEIFGSGRQKCGSCYGNGYVEKHCPKCGGTGYTLEACSELGPYKHVNLCPICYGKGRIQKTKQESYYE